MFLSDMLYRVRKNLIIVLSFTLILFITSQFVVMATVQTRGFDIGRIRREQEQIRLENERLRAEINLAKTNAKIVQDLNERFKLDEVRSKVVGTANEVAQSE